MDLAQASTYERGLSAEHYPRAGATQMIICYFQEVEKPFLWMFCIHFLLSSWKIVLQLMIILSCLELLRGCFLQTAGYKQSFALRSGGVSELTTVLKGHFGVRKRGHFPALDLRLSGCEVACFTDATNKQTGEELAEAPQPL